LMWTKHLYRGLDTGSGQRTGREEAQVQLGRTKPWMRRQAKVGGAV
jgi:hypothetical protein